MIKKFQKVFEAASSRYERAGYLEGDCVTLRKNYKRTKVYQNAASNVKELIDKMASSDLNLRVVGLKQKNPSNYYQANPENQTDDVILTVALDDGGGRYTQLVNISPDMVDSLDYKPNLPPIPNSVKKQFPVNIKPEPLEVDDSDEQQHKAAGAGPAPGSTNKVEKDLPVANKKIGVGDGQPTPAQYYDPVNWMPARM